MKKPTVSSISPTQAADATEADSLRVTIISAQPAQAGKIFILLQAMMDSALVEQIDCPITQFKDFDKLRLPDVLIVDCACDGVGDLVPLERISRTYPSLAFILVCEHQSPDFLLHAMRAGVREVLRAPVDPVLLEASLERIRHTLGFTPTRKGKVCAFVSCKGGSGATFLAANLAHALAMGGDRKVALLDLNLQFGDALLFLSTHNPTTTLADVARNVHRLDPALLAASMVRVEPNLSVLAAPEDPAHGNDVKLEHIDALIKMARQQYDFVLLDVGSSLDAQTIRALDQADIVFVVLQLSLPYLRDGQRLLGAFRTLGYPASKISLVVNRYAKGGEIELATIEATLGAKVLHTVPNHEASVASSINHGTPIARVAPGSAVTKAVGAWATDLAGGPKQQAPGWIPRLFKSS
jgi:pilus assembly protein CpaE